MDQNPEPRELTPEERLFKIIQESEKAEGKDDTLIVSSEKPASEEPALSKPDAFPDESSKLGQFAQKLEVHADPLVIDQEARARRPAIGMPKIPGIPRLPRFHFSGPSSARQILGKFTTVKTTNYALTGVLAFLVFYFLTNQVFVKESSSADFMKRANAMTAPSLEYPSHLFGVDEVNKNLETVANRNAFQPWKPPAPKPVDASGPVIPSGLLASVVPNLKLSGIYFGEQPEALIEATDEKRTHTVGVGGKIKGLTVKEIKPDGVVLTDGSAEQIIR